MTNQAKLLTIAFAALLALSLQAGRVSAFDSPVEQPPPPRPTPPAYVEPIWHTQVDAPQSLARDLHARHDRSETSAGGTNSTGLAYSTVSPPLTLASVDGVSLMWAWVVE